MRALTTFGLKEESCVDKHVLKYLSRASTSVETVGCRALVASPVTGAFGVLEPLSR